MKHLIVSAIFIFFSQNLLAYDMPNTGSLFRVDTRSYTEIFSNGLSPFGNNDSVRDHSRGVSCIGRGQDSAFISTTSDPEYAGTYARRLVALRNAPVYVYIFDSTARFYNMASSLSHAGYTAGINDARTQSEWISHGLIPASSIIGVRIYTGEQTPAMIHNPNYVSQTPSINNAPYTSDGQYSLPGTANVYANLAPLVSACMAATLSCFNPSGLKRKSGDTCNYIEPYKKETVLIYSTFF
ncbi:scabin-related ADP-ribosyltransferase [Aeromonas salmonicida]|uniref:scabin-related ADP-ribosyltransferase n=1 Tax=Aeromonas salmonicida TaxID=645 RepID=UPI003D1CE143